MDSAMGAGKRMHKLLQDFQTRALDKREAVEHCLLHLSGCVLYVIVYYVMFFLQQYDLYWQLDETLYEETSPYPLLIVAEYEEKGWHSRVPVC